MSDSVYIGDDVLFAIVGSATDAYYIKSSCFPLRYLRNWLVK